MAEQQPITIWRTVRAMAAFLRQPVFPYTGRIAAFEVSLRDRLYVVIHDDLEVIQVYRYRPDTDKLRLLHEWPDELNDHRRLPVTGVIQA